MDIFVYSPEKRCVWPEERQKHPSLSLETSSGSPNLRFYFTRDADPPSQSQKPPGSEELPGLTSLDLFLLEEHPLPSTLVSNAFSHGDLQSRRCDLRAHCSRPPAASSVARLAFTIFSSSDIPDLPAAHSATFTVPMRLLRPFGHELLPPNQCLRLMHNNLLP